MSWLKLCKLMPWISHDRCFVSRWYWNHESGVIWHVSHCKHGEKVSSWTSQSCHSRRLLFQLHQSSKYVPCFLRLVCKKSAQIGDSVLHICWMFTFWHFSFYYTDCGATAADTLAYAVWPSWPTTPHCGLLNLACSCVCKRPPLHLTASKTMVIVWSLRKNIIRTFILPVCYLFNGHS